ncbi:MAG: pyridoxal-phosphate dependent enzyme [Planctomycetota bacterium]
MTNLETRVYDSILDMLSSAENPTPLLRLNRVVPFTQAKVYAKLEWYNPFGSVKDRVAANMIRDGVERGTIGPEQELVEPTSGNTGMGLAMLANARGYHLTTPLSKAIPAEKRVMLKVFGANVEELEDTLCPAPGAPEGAIARAMHLGSTPGWHMLNQYQNEANLEAHVRATGPEIWRQTEGKITHFVAGLGTCGTITGNGRFLKAKHPGVQVIAVHPEPGHDIPGVRSLPQLKQTKLFHPEEYDQLVEVTNREAFDMCLRLIREESLIAGPSSGMALVGALKVIEDDPDAVVVVIFPDNAFKYASSFEKHFPELQVAHPEVRSGPSDQEAMLAGLIENSRNPRNTLEVDDLEQHLASAEAAPYLLDVRAPEVYAKQHVAGAVNIPVDEISRRRGELPQEHERPIVTVCNRGNLSINGMLVLQSLGYKNVRSLNGGTIAWAERGLPTAEGAQG